MKTNFKQLMMPLAVAVLGIAGAFTTMSMGKTETLSHVVGYKFLAGQNVCESSIMCDTEDTGASCFDGGDRVWNKLNPNDANCPIPLYRIEE